MKNNMYQRFFSVFVTPLKCRFYIKIHTFKKHSITFINEFIKGLNIYGSFIIHTQTQAVVLESL